MRIGIIGSEISGLAAGRILAKDGHEVIVVERNRSFGGKMVSKKTGNGSQSICDYGTSCFIAETPEFSAFIAELISQNLVRIWGESFSFYDGKELLPDNPNRIRKTRYAAVKGMSAISNYLGRHCDFISDDFAGGITKISTGSGKKRPWMINLTSYRTIEVDAVIISTPAPEAYGVILTAQDEPDMLTAIRDIDIIDYTPAITLMASYKGANYCNWDAVISQDDSISFISNESSKRPVGKETTLVIESTADFAYKNRDLNRNEITNQLLQRLGKITGKWALTPDWTDLHFWTYNQPKRVLQKPFITVGEGHSPLALTGDYFENFSPESAYCSGVKLARYLIDSFKESSMHKDHLVSA